ncbi:Hypothetical predicted protein [Octopus vulgaris]|uniref:Uncharacterized protein n=1 Tax=Octopus vulgaris TaxID=6645 RepID=A0AA36B4N6_OCTVU|nr:Hypothetical predicted protein [Octopus vulgaris]
MQPHIANTKITTVQAHEEREKVLNAHMMMWTIVLGPQKRTANNFQPGTMISRHCMDFARTMKSISAQSAESYFTLATASPNSTSHQFHFVHI